MQISEGYLNNVIISNYNQGVRYGILKMADELYKKVESPEFLDYEYIDGSIYFPFKIVKECMEELMKEYEEQKNE